MSRGGRSGLAAMRDRASKLPGPKGGPEREEQVVMVTKLMVNFELVVMVMVMVMAVAMAMAMAMAMATMYILVMPASQGTLRPFQCSVLLVGFCVAC